MGSGDGIALCGATEKSGMKEWPFSDCGVEAALRQEDSQLTSEPRDRACGKQWGPVPLARIPAREVSLGPSDACYGTSPVLARPARMAGARADARLPWSDNVTRTPDIRAIGRTSGWPRQMGSLGPYACARAGKRL